MTTSQAIQKIEASGCRMLLGDDDFVYVQGPMGVAEALAVELGDHEDDLRAVLRERQPSPNATDAVRFAESLLGGTRCTSASPKRAKKTKNRCTNCST